ncbi:TIGR02266 family protein [Corallococcus sp. ZKHCc1 1396]|uniref:TIGR02266 family protein n=1 Tax=Corallococcus soli TaxID=2710757 RepID=A0ABR9PNS7_9BACT|nr:MULTISPECIES: TIGR02266 family protein [Corallococcus]MBE4749570.1 TIGR02266 family protein [Corallococcus soli]MCY1036970.1 TIGR02266 family protein [Corallococcus sp. BB11-1]
MSDTPEHPVPAPRAHRIDHELPVAYRTVSGFVTDWAVNLSRGGLYINTQQPLPVGTVVRILVSLPGASFPVDLAGKVTRTNAQGAGPGGEVPGMAVEFVDVDDDKRSRIEAFVERLREALPADERGSTTRK